MKRLVALVVSAAALLVVVGCGRSYENRLEATLTRMRYQQRLDQNLRPAEVGKLQESAIYLRPPLSLEPTQQPGLNAPAGLFDVIQTYMSGAGGGEAEKKESAPALPTRLHVLARVNRKKAEAKKKKGEAAEPEPAVQRGEFVQDVRSLLAADLGGQEALSNNLQTERKRNNEYRRLLFNASNGDSIRVYFFKQAEYELALVWDIPPGQEKAPALVTGSELMLESLAVGPRALTAFQSGEVEDTDAAPAAGGAGAGGNVPGQPF